MKLSSLRSAEGSDAGRRPQALLTYGWHDWCVWAVGIKRLSQADHGMAPVELNAEGPHGLSIGSQDRLLQ